MSTARKDTRQTGRKKLFFLCHVSIHQTGASFYIHGLDKRIYMLRKNALFKMTKGQTNNKKQAPTSKQTTIANKQNRDLYIHVHIIQVRVAY